MLRRWLALGSAASVLAALGVAVSTAGTAAASPVTFTSRTATLSIASFHSATPAGSGTATGSGTASNLAGDGADTGGKNFTTTISPKGDRGRNSNHATGGVTAPATASSGASLATPTTSSSFAGQASSPVTCHYFLVGCNPPDMGLGAGPNFVLQGVNTQWAVYNTAGAIQPGWPVSAQNFFGAPNVPHNCDKAHLNQPFLSDPRALYDPADGRYWASMLQVENALGIAPKCPFLSVIWVAVSQTSNPSGAWNIYEFNTSIDGQFANDYDQIGVNGQGVFVSANMFGPSTGLNGGFYAELFEANKADMEQGKTNFTPDAFFDMLGFGPGTAKFGSPFIADTVQPAMNYDSSAGSDETFVDTVDGPDLHNGHLCGFNGGGFSQSCSGLVVWRMANAIAHDSGGSAPTLAGTFVDTNPFLLSPPQTQPSCSQCVDALDLRITGTPVIRNGVLYGSWDTAIQDSTQVVAGLEWAAVSLSSNTATTGYFSDNSQDNGSATFGALMPDGQGNVTMVFDHMSSSTFPEIRYITKAAGDANFSGPGVLLKAGQSSYRPQRCGTSIIPVCRWGDYEATSFDGAGNIWFSSQYANLYVSLTDSQNGRNWSTWIGAISAS